MNPKQPLDDMGGARELAKVVALVAEYIEEQTKGA